MTERKALLLGATGLIGGFVLKTLLEDGQYSEVTALVRKPLLTTHRKLKEVVTKFDNLEHICHRFHCDDIFCCLGTTIKNAGSQSAFRSVDCALVVHLAEVMQKQGASQFLVISAMGADKDSKVFYNRTKGEMEEALKGLGYPSLRIIRPSLLLGPRKEFRLGERIAVVLAPVLKHVLLGSLKKYRPVEAVAVANFMVRIALHPVPGVHVYESDAIEPCLRSVSTNKGAHDVIHSP